VLHQCDLEQGVGRVYLSSALKRKYLNRDEALLKTWLTKALESGVFSVTDNFSVAVY